MAGDLQLPTLQILQMQPEGLNLPDNYVGGKYGIFKLLACRPAGLSLRPTPRT